MKQIINNKSIYWAGNIKEVTREIRQLSASWVTVFEYIKDRMKPLE